MYPSITKVEHLDDYRLKVTFSNGESGVLDLAKLSIASEGRLVPLQEVRYFAKAHIDPTGQTVVWPNGLALKPDVLYERTMRAQVEAPLRLLAAASAVLAQHKIIEAEWEFAQMRRAARHVLDNDNGEGCNTPEEMFAQLNVERWGLKSKLKV